MKPPVFEYTAVGSIDEAVAELGRHGDRAKLLAGGQSLVPLLNMRLAAPERLIDLNRVAELAYVRVRDGGLAVGAMTRQRAVERSALAARHAPLLAWALPWVGHFQIRNRGTIGGSLSHADPAAELPAVALCLDARMTARGPTGERTIAAGDFFLTQLTTALAPTELLTEVWFPPSPPGSGSAWLEVARRHGDYALVGVGAVLTLKDGRIEGARLALTGVGDRPVRATQAEARLVGERFAPPVLTEAVEAVRRAIDPGSDIHATAAYRRHVAGVLVERAISIARVVALLGLSPLTASEHRAGSPGDRP